jgi:Asp-tRNA(Asn)/Glu-tRNA(Gln) amidotransferase B subunit
MQSRSAPMNEDVKSLVQQYIEIRKKQRNDLMQELGLSEQEADQAVSTLELYYHVEASEDQWTQAWKAAKRDFLAEGERTGIRLADLVVKYVDIARLGGGPESRWT